MPKLHLFSQAIWHGEAFIVGNLAGLAAIRDAIDAAIMNGMGMCSPFVNDGEGYDAIVLCLEDSAIDRLAVPYSEPIAQHGSKEAAWPWDVPGVKEFYKSQVAAREAQQ